MKTTVVIPLACFAGALALYQWGWAWHYQSAVIIALVLCGVYGGPFLYFFRRFMALPGDATGVRRSVLVCMAATVASGALWWPLLAGFANIRFGTGSVCMWISLLPVAHVVLGIAAGTQDVLWWEERVSALAPNVCPRCNYNLAGLEPPVVCPECGHEK